MQVPPFGQESGVQGPSVQSTPVYGGGQSQVFPWLEDTQIPPFRHWGIQSGRQLGPMVHEGHKQLKMFKNVE